jgi:hypothetical protein
MILNAFMLVSRKLIGVTVGRSKVNHQHHRGINPIEYYCP